MAATDKRTAFGIQVSLISADLDGDGLRWLEREFSAYDFSTVERFALRDGSTSKKKPPGVWGMCSYPRRGRGYKITCSVKQPLPVEILTRQRPLYKREDGSFPSTPYGMRRGQLFVSQRGGRERAWHRLYGTTILRDADEAVLWIVAHEMYHYLRRTRQVDGTNNEIEADAFSDETLRCYRRCAGAA
jgi:isopentenyldiphosphate isomerase